MVRYKLIIAKLIRKSNRTTIVYKVEVYIELNKKSVINYSNLNKETMDVLSISGSIYRNYRDYCCMGQIYDEIEEMLEKGKFEINGNIYNVKWLMDKKEIQLISLMMERTLL